MDEEPPRGSATANSIIIIIIISLYNDIKLITLPFLVLLVGHLLTENSAVLYLLQYVSVNKGSATELTERKSSY